MKDIELKIGKTIILRESLLSSVLKDLFTFGCMFFLYYLNHKFTDGSGIIDFSITVFIFFVIIGKAAKSEMTIDEAIDFLTKQKDKQNG